MGHSPLRRTAHPSVRQVAIVHLAQARVFHHCLQFVCMPSPPLLPGSSLLFTETFPDDYDAKHIAAAVEAYNERKDFGTAGGAEGLTFNTRAKTLFFPKHIMREFFIPTTIDPTIRCVTNIFDGLKSRSEPLPTRIALVGGFANSALLQQYLSRVASTHGVSMTSARMPGAAVVAGAALFGLQPNMIKRRISRFTYAVLMSEVYDPLIHDPSLRFSTPNGDRIICLTPLVQKGDKLLTNEKIKRPNLAPMRDDQRTVDFKIYALDNLIADPGNKRDKDLRTYVVEEGKSYGKSPTIREDRCIGTLIAVIGAEDKPRSERLVTFELSFAGTEVWAICTNAAGLKSRLRLKAG